MNIKVLILPKFLSVGSSAVVHFYFIVLIMTDLKVFSCLFVC